MPGERGPSVAAWNVSRNMRAIRTEAVSNPRSIIAGPLRGHNGVDYQAAADSRLSAAATCARR